MEIRPRLKLLGSFGLEVTADYSGTLIKIPLGKRRRVVVQVDDPRGQRQFVLKHNVLPATTNGAVELETGERRAKALYYFEFYQARKAEGDGSFILTCPLTGNDYLGVFTDDKLTFEMFANKLFRTGGVAIEQVDEDDVPTLDDGSLGEYTANPAQI